MEEPVIKSMNDLNDYEVFTLDNGMKVMLINDGHLPYEGDQLAYCALAINAGAFNDPLDRQGLAHLLEHMIFMGSKKYRQEGAYDEHLSNKGGQANAFTQFEKTTFHFNV